MTKESNDKSTNDEEFRSLLASDTIKEFNDKLTKAMASQRHMALIKDERLDEVVDFVCSLAAETEGAELLTSAAVLGRIAAVARGREAQVHGKVPALFNEAPVSVDLLKESEEKEWAAKILRHSNIPDLVQHCLTESIEIESAEKARREFTGIVLAHSESLESMLRAYAENSKSLRDIENLDSRYIRVRRIFNSVQENISAWEGGLGNNVGEALALFYKSFVKIPLKGLEESVLFDIADTSMKILLRIIELRFSYALLSDSYSLIAEIKRIFGAGMWQSFLRESSSIQRIRLSLLEAALVIARQNKTDRNIMTVLVASYYSKQQAKSAIADHFEHARELDPDIREWWVNAGEVKTSRNIEQKMGNSEDQQIGALMIEVEDVKLAMSKLERAIIPFLELHDPVLASTVKRTSAGYENISRISRRLGRMRKLMLTSLKGEQVEYNPLQHDMLGGHKPGIRKVKVVRDGVQKDFAGKIKTLVKCWVEPQE